MKKILLLMLFPVFVLAALLYSNSHSVPREERLTMKVEEASLIPVTYVTSKVRINSQKTPETNSPETTVPDNFNKSDEIVRYALTLLGTPYLYGGISRNGFDCSGFITHVFKENGVAVKRSSALQATEGKEINRSEAAPGDLVIFTGTDRTVREPGHVGIVISEPGDTIKFIHSSSARSESGVKISQVEGSGYEARFLSIRRIL